MKLVLGWILATILFKSVVSQHEDQQVLAASVEFSNELFDVLTKEDSNLLFSPISLHATLSMAYQGAGGTTAAAFAEALKVPEAKITSEGYKAIIPTLNDVENVTLLIADRIFVNEGSRILEDYKTAITTDFYSDVQLLNFEENVDAAQAINDWVAEETHDKIKDLVASSDLDKYTRLVLVNAVYFKSQWAYEFNINNTVTESFFVNPEEIIEVDTMQLDIDTKTGAKPLGTKFVEELNARVLELPYNNDDVSMVIILPSEIDGIKTLEENLHKVDVTTLTEDLTHNVYGVKLPKFKIEQTLDLKEPLTKIGLGEIFEKEKANFRNMIDLQPDEELYVSKIQQKVFIEVNEEGAEAAAASDSSISLPSVVLFKFVVNHPFVFLLVEKSTKNILFYGKVVKP